VIRGLDTNVLVYAHSTEAPHHRVALRLLRPSASAGDTWAVCWPVLYEFLRVVTHPRVFHPPTPVDTAWRAVTSLTRLRNVVVLSETERHQEILDEVLRASGATGNLVHDAHIVALLREHGVGEIVTADEDFRRFPGLTVTNPFRSGA